MEEIKDLIGKEDYDKYKKLLQEFECKAIDTIENLTWQFKEELAEEIDDKIKGWKKESERLLKENWVKDDKIKKLEQELAELKEKDNYHLRYELAGADETITNLKQQLEEKNKEIERLKFFEKIYYQNQLQASQETINKLFQSAYQSPVAVGLNQIAIQELEKVKDYIQKHKYKTLKEDRHIVYYKSLKDQIDNQIKALKGNNDEPRQSN